MENYIIVNCPHCKDEILIFKNEINCTIFRHAVYKANGQQISPHERKEECDRLFRENLVYGCAKPFRVDRRTFEVSDCGYI